MKSRSDPRRLIGLAGFAGAGKSKVAEVIEFSHGWRRDRFAGPLKDMLRALCRSCGVDAATAERMIEGDLKEQRAGALAWRTPRGLMRTLGTEWGRDVVGPDFWCDLMRPRLMAPDAGRGRVVEDVRFANEAALIREAGGRIWRISGRGDGPSDHASEAQDFPADRVIDNSGTVPELWAAIDRALAEDFGGPRRPQ